MFSRRDFLNKAAAVSAVSFLPVSTRERFAEHQSEVDTIIDAVDIVRISGPYNSTPGLNKQHQANPVHLYPDQRPATYKDDPNAKPTPGTLRQDYLQIRTKGGITGLYGLIDGEAVSPILRQLKPFLMGKNALMAEAIWDQLYRRNRHSRAGHYMMALSAVDNVLWDIRGKRYGAPVFDLLGGTTRKEIQVYGSCLGYSVEKGKVGPRARQLYDQGFVHQKWFLAFGPGDGNAGLQRNIELVAELRESLGTNAQIMFDAFMSWDLPFAVSWCKAVERYAPYWIEEAFPVDHLESFIQLSQATSIPVATGEHFYSRWEVLNYLKAGAVKIIQADPEWCGGVSELVKICHLASAFGAKVFPHGHNIPAALHVVASQSPEVCPLVEYLLLHVGSKLHFQKDAPLTTTGKLPLPTSPGFGIVLDDNKIETREIISV
jgi:L-alanine-DL-glutamate epimerase-like enolase superfamily enzyme